MAGLRKSKKQSQIHKRRMEVGQVDDGHLGVERMAKAESWSWENAGEFGTSE